MAIPSRSNNKRAVVGRALAEDPSKMVFGVDDFDGLIDLASIELGVEVGSHRVVVACRQHSFAGTMASYTDGLILLHCHVCEKLVCQLEVAKVSRRQKKDMRH